MQTAATTNQMALMLSPRCVAMLPKAHPPSSAIANHISPLTSLLSMVSSHNFVFLVPPAPAAVADAMIAQAPGRGDRQRRAEARPLMLESGSLQAAPSSMYISTSPISSFDPELARALSAERQRQEDHIELIASENYASPRVLEAQGSVLTNKYAEGYPGKRYYGGCEYVDIAEQLAIDRAKKLFGADYANVQPHSGSHANQA